MTFREFARILVDPDDPYRLYSYRLFGPWWRQLSLLFVALAAAIATGFILDIGRADDEIVAATFAGALFAFPSTFFFLRFHAPHHWKPELLHELVLTPMERDRVAVAMLRAPLRSWAIMAGYWTFLVFALGVLYYVMDGEKLVMALGAAVVVAGCWIVAAAATIPHWLRRPYGITRVLLASIGETVAIGAPCFAVGAWLVVVAEVVIRYRDPGLAMLLYLAIPVVVMPVLALRRSLEDAGDRAFAPVDDEPLARRDPAEARRRLRRLQAEEGLVTSPRVVPSSVPLALGAMLLLDLFHALLGAVMEALGYAFLTEGDPLFPPPLGGDGTLFHQFSWLRVLFTSFVSLGSFASLAILLPIVTAAMLLRRGGWARLAIHPGVAEPVLWRWYLPVLGLLIGRASLNVVAFISGAGPDAMIPYSILAFLLLMQSAGVFTSMMPARGRTRRAVAWVIVGLAQFVIYIVGFRATGPQMLVLPGETAAAMIPVFLMSVVLPTAVVMIHNRYRLRLHREDLQGIDPLGEPEARPIGVGRLWLLFQDRTNPFFLHRGLAHRPHRRWLACGLLAIEAGLALALIMNVKSGSLTEMLVGFGWVAAAPVNAILVFLMLAPREWTREQLEELLLTRLRRDEVVAGVLRPTLLWMIPFALLWATLPVGYLLSQSPGASRETMPAVIALAMGVVAAAVLATGIAIRRWLRTPDRLIPFIIGTAAEYLAQLVAISLVCGAVACLPTFFRSSDDWPELLLSCMPLAVVMAGMKFSAALKRADTRFFARADEESFIESDWEAAASKGVDSEELKVARRALPYGWRGAATGYLLAVVCFFAFAFLVCYVFPMVLAVHGTISLRSQAASWAWQRWKPAPLEFARLPFTFLGVVPLAIITAVFARWLEIGRRWSARIEVPRRLAVAAQVRRAIPVAVLFSIQNLIAIELQPSQLGGPLLGPLNQLRLVGGAVLGGVLIGLLVMLLFGAMLPVRGRSVRARGLMLTAILFLSGPLFGCDGRAGAYFFPALSEFGRWILLAHFAFGVVAIAFLFPRGMQGYHEEGRISE